MLKSNRFLKVLLHIQENLLTFATKKKNSVCRKPRCACQHSKKDNSEFRWHAFVGTRFFIYQIHLMTILGADTDNDS